MTDIKAMFPVLRRTVHGKRLAYLDSAASAQKPLLVTDAEKEFYEKSYANVHRGIHTLAEEATEKYEEARGKIAHFIRALPEEIIFTSGTTASLNIAAQMLVPTFQDGEIVITGMEHHSNFVPWQQLAKRHGLAFRVVPVTPDFTLGNLGLTEKTRIVAITHASNVLGTVNPIKQIVKEAHAKGALVVVDGAQAVPHRQVNVKDLAVDFYAFSGHKMYGPSGIGVLYGKKALLEKFDPPLYGGEMVKDVTIERTTWNDIPLKFEPGTPNIAGAVALGAAVDFIYSVGYGRIREHEHDLTEYALAGLRKIDGVSIIGPQNAEGRQGAISFVIAGVHAHDAAALLDQEGIAVRAGHHCTQPLHCALGIDASVRASIGIYNTRDDIDRLVAGVKKVKETFA